MQQALFGKEALFGEEGVVAGGDNLPKPALLGQQLFSAQTPATTGDAAGGARAMASSVDKLTIELSNWLQRQGR